MDDTGLIRITYTKSAIGYSKRQKDTVRSLGLRRIGESVVQPDSPSIRGMTHAVRHLVTVETIDEVEVVAADSSEGGDE
jgi:large subunit ribosomal protein L30